MTLLSRLVVAQAHDAKRYRLRPRSREIREADLLSGRNPSDPHGTLDRFEADLPQPWELLEEERRPRVLIGFTTTWTSSVVGYDPRHPGACPGCEDHELRIHELCVICSRSRVARRRHPHMDRHERARILAGPVGLVARVERARTRRERRAVAV